MVKGRCLCGAVEFEVDTPEQKLLEGIACHCSSCKTVSSGASFNIQGETDAIRITKGERAFRTYVDTGRSGKPMKRNFCGECGSALYSAPDSMPGVAFIKVGPLDISEKVKLGAEIFCENAHPTTLHQADTVTRLDAKMEPFKG